MHYGWEYFKHPETFKKTPVAKGAGHEIRMEADSKLR